MAEAEKTATSEKAKLAELDATAEEAAQDAEKACAAVQTAQSKQAAAEKKLADLQAVQAEVQANLASKQADSAAAAKIKEAADLALTEAKKHLAILEEANEPSETPTTPSDNKPSETPTTPSEDEPSESPADAGETETIVIPAGKTETKATVKKQAQLCRKPAKARISPPFWQGLWHCWPVPVSSPLAGVRRTKSNCINNKSIGKATLFQSRFLYTVFLKK